MAVKIRLMRVGKRKQPSFRVVVADSRKARNGRIIETIGHYGPRQEPSRIEIDGDRALAWLRQGAQPTESVQKLLTTNGVWATFEAEKQGPIDTKMNRRAWVTGRGTLAPKAPKKAPKAPKAPPAPPVEEAPTETPVAESAEAETPEAETPEAETPEAETTESETAGE